MMPDIQAKLEEIFRVVLDLPEDADVTGLRRINHEKWDSLVTVTMVAAIESELGIELSAEQQERITSFQSALLLLEEATT
jgi:acyl carrier protein